MSEPLGPTRSLKGKTVKKPPKVALSELTPNNVGTARCINNALFPVPYSDKFYKDALMPELDAFERIAFYQDLPVGAILCRLDSSSSPSPANLSALLATPSPSLTPELSKTGKPKEAPTHKLYIATLGVLAPYRNQGLGSKLVQHVLNEATATHSPPAATQYKIKLPEKDKGAAKDKDAKVDKKKEKEREKEKAEAMKPPPRPLVKSVWVHVQVGNEAARKFWEGHGFKLVDTVEDYYRKIEPTSAWVLEREINAPEPAAAA